MKQQIIIDGKTINETSEPYLIAEIGLNHNNDIELAKKSVSAAKESGANAVKFQTYVTEKLLKRDSETFELFKNLELTKKHFEEIFDYCKDIGITFFSTPFSYESVDLLMEIGVPCFKIASMDLNYYDFIHYIAKTGKPVILSTGMANFGEIDKAVNTIRKTG
nr:N-acetylneuraminate synthase family protein [Spirochaetota bacterium]